MTVTTRIDGLDGLAASLRAAPRATRKLLRGLLRDSAGRVAAQAKTNAPRDRGDLQNAITVAGRGLSWRAGIASGPAPGRTGSRTHVDPAIYGTLVHNGSSRTAARPFMRAPAQAEEARLGQELRSVAAQLAAMTKAGA